MHIHTHTCTHTHKEERGRQREREKVRERGRDGETETQGERQRENTLIYIQSIYLAHLLAYLTSKKTHISQEALYPGAHLPGLSWN